MNQKQLKNEREEKMIRVQKAKKEARRRDEKRGRFELLIGKKKIHLTLEEVLHLRAEIEKAVVAYSMILSLKELLK